MLGEPPLEEPQEAQLRDVHDQRVGLPGVLTSLQRVVQQSLGVVESAGDKRAVGSRREGGPPQHRLLPALHRLEVAVEHPVGLGKIALRQQQDVAIESGEDRETRIAEPGRELLLLDHQPSAFVERLGMTDCVAAVAQDPREQRWIVESSRDRQCLCTQTVA